MNCCVVALSLFYSGVLTWIADSLYSVQWHKGSGCRKICIITSSNFAKTLVWKLGNDVKLRRHKQRTPNTNDHHMTFDQTPPWNFLRTPLNSRPKACFAEYSQQSCSFYYSHWILLWLILKSWLFNPALIYDCLVIREHALPLNQLCPTQMAYWAKKYVTILTRTAHWMTY